MADLSVTEPTPGGPAAELVRFEVAGGVATITLDSPANRNALSAAVRSALTTALTVAAADPAARVVVLSHDGPVFCSGMDLKEEAVAAPGRAGGPRAAGDPAADLRLSQAGGGRGQGSGPGRRHRVARRRRHRGRRARRRRSRSPRCGSG